MKIASLLVLFLFASPCIGQKHVQVIKANHATWITQEGVYISYGKTNADSLCRRIGHLTDTEVCIPSRKSIFIKATHKVLDRGGKTTVVYYYTSEPTFFDCLRCRMTCCLMYHYTDTVKVKEGL